MRTCIASFILFAHRLEDEGTLLTAAWMKAVRLWVLGIAVDIVEPRPLHFSTAFDFPLPPPAQPSPDNRCGWAMWFARWTTQMLAGLGPGREAERHARSFLRTTAHLPRCSPDWGDWIQHARVSNTRRVAVTLLADYRRTEKNSAALWNRMKRRGFGAGKRSRR